MAHQKKDAKREALPRAVPASPPIVQTSVYNFPDLKSIDDYYEGRAPGSYFYSRYGLPNSDELAEKVAKLENAKKGVACSSGMAALFVAIASSCGQGDQIVASPDLYGGTLVMLQKELPRFGITTTFCDPAGASSFENEMNRRKAKIALVETISNPTMKVCDVKALATAANRTGTTLIVDNTFATPFVVRPLESGAHIVMHSGTKSLGGHQDLTIGIVCGGSKIMERAFQFNVTVGAIAGPFDSWLASRSIETWRIRTVEGCRNAMRLAEFLEGRREVEEVFYPGLESHPQHVIAKRLFDSEMYGAMLSFKLKGGLAKADSFVKALKRVTLTPSLGGVKTTISHPAKTSHRKMPEKQRRKLGITDSMIRVSVGVEDYSVIAEDLARALKSTR